jgi:hypothetical protein
LAPLNLFILSSIYLVKALNYKTKMQKQKPLFKAKLVKLCDSLYVSPNGLTIHCVRPSMDSCFHLVVDYSTDESPSKLCVVLKDSTNIKQFTTLLEEQIALQQSGPLSDPNIVKWISS